MRIVTTLLCVTFAVLLPVHAQSGSPGARNAYDFAAGLHDRGLHDRAVREFRRFLEEHPRDTRAGKARFYLGQSLMALDRRREALPCFEKARKLEGRLGALARLRAGEILTREGNHREALERLQALEKQESWVGLREAAGYFAGECHEALGALDRARRSWGGVIRDAPKGTYAPYAALSLGYLELRDGKSVASVAAFERVPGASELAKEARVMACEARLRGGDHDAARKGFEKALRGGLDDDLALTAGLGLARAWSEMGQDDSALAVFRECVRRRATERRVHQALIAAAARSHERGANAAGAAYLQLVKGAEGREAEDLAYWRGKLAADRGDLKAGISALRTAVAAGGDPAQRSRRQFTLGQALTRAGQHEEAASLFKKVRGKAGDDALRREATFAEAFSRNRLGEFDTAVGLLGRLTKQDLANDLAADAWFALGENYFALKRDADAVRAYQKARQLDADRLGEKALYKLGWCCHRLERHDDAIRWFETLLEEHRKSSFAAEARYLVAKSHEAAGRDEDAQRAFRKLSRENGAKLGREAALGEAAAARRRKDLKSARRALERALEMPGDEALHADALAQLVSVHQEAGEIEEAEAAARRFLDDHPKDPRAPKVALDLAWARYALKDFDAASKIAGGLHPRMPEGHLRGECLYLAALAEQAGGHHDAVNKRLRRLEKELSGHERLEAAHLLRGLARARSGNPKAAIPDLARFVKRTPDTADRDVALYELAFCYEALNRQEDRDRAFLLLVRQHAKSPLSIDASFRMGESAYAADDVEAALAHYRRVLESEGGDRLRDRAAYKAGWCHRKAGRHGEAMSCFDVVAKLKDSALAAEAGFLAGEAAAEAGNDEDAARRFARMAKRHPRHELAPEAGLRRVLALGAQKRHQDVARLAPAALAAKGDGATALRVRSLLGDAFFARRAWDRARAAYRDVTKNSEGPLAARAQRRIGEAFARDDRRDDALDAFLKVEILYGHADEAAKALLRAAELFVDAKETAKSRRLLKRLVSEYPKYPEAKKAQALLGTSESSDH